MAKANISENLVLQVEPRKSSGNGRFKRSRFFPTEDERFPFGLCLGKHPGKSKIFHFRMQSMGEGFRSRLLVPGTRQPLPFGSNSASCDGFQIAGSSPPYL